MAKLSILTFEKRNALEALGLETVCGSCENEIGAVASAISQQPSNDLEGALFCQDGNIVLCGSCVLQRQRDEVKRQENVANTERSKLANIRTDIVSLIGRSIE